MCVDSVGGFYLKALVLVYAQYPSVVVKVELPRFHSKGYIFTISLKCCFYRARLVLAIFLSSRAGISVFIQLAMTGF